MQRYGCLAATVSVFMLLAGGVKADAAGAGDNVLEVDVVNLWFNRLLSDARLPVEDRIAKTNAAKHIRGGQPLNPNEKPLPSGLPGPVKLERMGDA